MLRIDGPMLAQRAAARPKNLRVLPRLDRVHEADREIDPPDESAP